MSEQSDVLIVYVTASSRDEADSIANALITEKLAACVNIPGEIASIYEWQGKVEHSNEIAFTAKTTADKYDLLEARVKEMHSYECPCIVAWPIEKGYGPYLDWVRGSIKN